MDKETREVFTHIATALQVTHQSLKEIVAAIEELDERVSKLEEVKLDISVQCAHTQNARQDKDIKELQRRIQELEDGF